MGTFVWSSNDHCGQTQYFSSFINHEKEALVVDFYFGWKRVSFNGWRWLATATQFHGPFAVFIERNYANQCTAHAQDCHRSTLAYVNIRIHTPAFLAVSSHLTWCRSSRVYYRLRVLAFYFSILENPSGEKFKHIFGQKEYYRDTLIVVLRLRQQSSLNVLKWYYHPRQEEEKIK